ncbi:hypothetical protein Q1695_010022 [Nippostrongylus brasiliensis]|nr:hypothetical protein Q1695_010022 [Nippostrongylus brasiliensis]
MDERGPAASTEENKSSGFFGGLRRGFLAKPSGSELPVDRTEDRASKGPRKGFLLSSKKEENGATEKKKDEGGGGRRMTEEASPPHKSSKIYNKCSADNPPFSSSGLEPTGIPVSSCGGCRGVVYVSSTYHYKVLCLENCTMDLHSECLTILLRRQDIGSIDELKIVTALKFKIHPALVYSFMDLDTVSGELSNGKPEPKKHSDEKNKARRTRDDVKTSPKKTSGVSTTSKTTSDPSDNLSGDGKEKKLCPNHPPEPLGPHGAVQVKESKPTMYAMEELLEPSLARSVENPSDAVFEGEKQDHLRVSDGAVQVKESEQTIYTVENSNELPNALPVESPSGVSSEGLRCLYSMDECRPAASPEDNKSSGFFGGLRRGFLAKRSESQVRVDSTEDRAPIGLRRGFLAKRSESVVRVDSTEDRASKGPRKGFLLSSKNEENGSTEKKKDESGGARHTTEGTSPHFSSVPSPPHESAKENSKCSADNTPFSPSGPVSAGGLAFTCAVCRLCWEGCAMDMHSECLTKLLRRQNIDSIAELKTACVGKHKIVLRCFCSAPLFLIGEHYLNCVDGYVHGAPIYSFLDLDRVRKELSNGKTEPKKHFDEKNKAKRARETSPKKTSEVSTTWKTASDPSDNMTRDGKGIRCMYSMDERRQVLVDEKEDRASNKCSADNPHFPPSGLESADIPAPACVDCLGVVNINSSYHYKAACWEECKMYLHSECLTKLLRRQNIDSVAELKKARVRKHKIALHCFNPCCSGLLLAIAEKYLNSVDGSAHSTIIYLLLDWDMEEAGQWSDEAEPEKHFDEKNLARRARDDVKASPKKTSGVSTTSKAASDPSDNLNGDGKEKKPCPTHPREPPGPNGAVQAVESKSTMYTVEKLLEPSPAASAENPSEAGLEGKKQGHLRAPDGAVQVKESEQTIYSVGNIPELPNALPVESPTVVSSEGIRCLYSMDERGPAASPEENKSSGFFGGLRRGFLAKRTGSEVPVDSKEDRTSKGLRSGATEKKKDEGGGDQHATEKTSPPHESSKVNNKCSADNPHFSPSGPGSEGIPVFTCGVLCVKNCTMYLHGECFTKWLSQHNIGSIDDLKIATALKFKIRLRCFNPRCPAPLLVILEDYLNCVNGHVYSMPIYSLMDLDWVAGQMSKDLAEAKEHLDGKNITRRARDVKTSSKKTSEVPTASKIPIDPSNNLKGDGKEKKPCPTHAPGPPGPNGAVQAKETKRTMHTKDKLPEPSPATSVENPRKAGLKGKGEFSNIPSFFGKKQGHPKTPDGIVQVKESEPTMYTVEKLPEQSPAAPVENPREAGLKGKGKKQGHLKAPDGAVQVKESEPTMYTVDNFPELPKALSVESPSIVYPEGEFPKEEQEHLYEADELRSVAPPAVPVLSLSPDLPTVEQPTQDDEEKVVEKYSVVSDPPKRNSKRARKKRNERECVQPDSIFKDDHEMVEAVVDGVKPFSRDLLLNTLHCAQPVERLRETIEMVMGRAYEPYRKPIDKIFNSEDLLRDFIGKLRIFIVSRERGRIIFSKSMYGRAMENQLQVTSAPPTISALSSPFCADGAGIERSDQLKDELTKPKNPSINPLGSLSGTYEKPFASSNRPVPRNPWKNVLDGAKTRSVTVEDRDCQVCLERFTSNGRVLSCPHKGCEEPYHEMVNFFLVTTN